MVETKARKIILASASAARRDMLARAGVTFEIERFQDAVAAFEGDRGRVRTSHQGFDGVADGLAEVVEPLFRHGG